MLTNIQKYRNFCKTYLWKKYRESPALWYQCVALAKLYCKEMWTPLKSFSGSAVAGWKTGSPFDMSWKRIYNTPTWVPACWDVVFFDASPSNVYGHVAIAWDNSNVNSLEILEQNWGRWSGTWTWTDAIRETVVGYKKCLWWFTKL